MDLLQIAIQARKNAYAPYSNVKVGAAIKTGSGDIIIGSNIENVRFGELICAERNAIFNAYLNGERKLTELAIVANYRGELKPCRLCRSVIAELCPNIKITTLNLNTKKIRKMDLKHLYKNTTSFEIRSVFRMLIRKILQ
jgi:cytidine deaminase